MTQKRPLIVGIDPGTTTGVAVFDLEGRLVLITSRKNLSRPKVIEIISEHGDPVVIASDKNPVPRFFEKFAASFDARLVYPRETLSRREKFIMAREYRDREGRVWCNSHERDALVAALNAWKGVKRKVRTIDKKVRLASLSGVLADIRDGVRKDVIVRKISIDRSIKERTGQV